MNHFWKKNKRLVTLGLLLGVGLAAIRWSLRRRADGEGERTGKVLRETLVQRVTIAGAVTPLRSTLVTAPYDGYVKKIYVTLQQPVKSGDPLVTLTQSLLASETVFPIRAPFDGVVTQIPKSEGQFAKQNDANDFVLRMDDLTRMFIYASAPEIDVVKIQKGMEADIKISAILSHNYQGVVREISQASTQQRDSWGGRSQVEYLVKIEMKRPDADLKPGMSAVVDIVTQKADNVLTLKHEFIQRENQDYFVVLKNGQRQSIKVGLQNESAFEVTDGLREGQEIRQVDFLKLIRQE